MNKLVYVRALRARYFQLNGSLSVFLGENLYSVIVKVGVGMQINLGTSLKLETSS